jgi:hypothetical protein
VSSIAAASVPSSSVARAMRNVSESSPPTLIGAATDASMPRFRIFAADSPLTAE